MPSIQVNVNTHGRYALPEQIASYAGQINDIDSHECTPIQHWVEEFGSEMARSISWVSNGRFSFRARPPYLRTRLSTRRMIRPSSPASLPTARSTACGWWIYTTTGAAVYRAVRIVSAPPRSWLGTLRQICYERMKCMIDGGVRAFMISPDTPPGGVSPAAPALDPLCAIAASAGCPILAHIAISEIFLKTLVWREAPFFKGWMLGGEFSLDPWTLSTIHFAVQNYLTTMVMGGVFRRHPKLRFGTAEFTGRWVGPFAENMDRAPKSRHFKETRAIVC